MRHAPQPESKRAPKASPLLRAASLLGTCLVALTVSVLAVYLQCRYSSHPLSQALSSATGLGLLASYPGRDFRYPLLVSLTGPDEGRVAAAASLLAFVVGFLCLVLPVFLAGVAPARLTSQGRWGRVWAWLLGASAVAIAPLIVAQTWAAVRAEQTLSFALLTVLPAICFLPFASAVGAATAGLRRRWGRMGAEVLDAMAEGADTPPTPAIVGGLRASLSPLLFLGLAVVGAVAWLRALAVAEAVPGRSAKVFELPVDRALMRPLSALTAGTVYDLACLLLAAGLIVARRPLLLIESRMGYALLAWRERVWPSRREEAGAALGWLERLNLSGLWTVLRMELRGRWRRAGPIAFAIASAVVALGFVVLPTKLSPPLARLDDLWRFFIDVCPAGLFEARAPLRLLWECTPLYRAFNGALIAWVVIALTLLPAAAGTAFAMERERGSLDFLRMTALGQGEILFGKVLAALAPFLLAAPVSLGWALWVADWGVPLGLVLGKWLLTMLLTVTIAAVAAAVSSFARRVSTAVAAAYVAAVVSVAVALWAPGPLSRPMWAFALAVLALFATLRKLDPYAVKPPDRGEVPSLREINQASGREQAGVLTAGVGVLLALYCHTFLAQPPDPNPRVRTVPKWRPATGKSPFEGDDIELLLAALLSEDPRDARTALRQADRARFPSDTLRMHRANLLFSQRRFRAAAKIYGSLPPDERQHLPSRMAAVTALARGRHPGLVYAGAGSTAKPSRFGRVSVHYGATPKSEAACWLSYGRASASPVTVWYYGGPSEGETLLEAAGSCAALGEGTRRNPGDPDLRFYWVTAVQELRAGMRRNGLEYGDNEALEKRLRAQLKTVLGHGPRRAHLVPRTPQAEAAIQLGEHADRDNPAGWSTAYLCLRMYKAVVDRRALWDLERALAEMQFVAAVEPKLRDDVSEATCLIALDRNDEAREKLERALREDRSPQRAHLYLAYLDGTEGDFAGALAHYEAAPDVRKYHPWLYIITLLAEGRIDDAAAACAKPYKPNVLPDRIKQLVRELRGAPSSEWADEGLSGLLAKEKLGVIWLPDSMAPPIDRATGWWGLPQSSRQFWSSPIATYYEHCFKALHERYPDSLNAALLYAINRAPTPHMRVQGATNNPLRKRPDPADFAETIAILEDVLSRCPDWGSARFWLSTYYDELGGRQSAREVLFPPNRKGPAATDREQP